MYMSSANLAFLIPFSNKKDIFFDRVVKAIDFSLFPSSRLSGDT